MAKVGCLHAFQARVLAACYNVIATFEFQLAALTCTFSVRLVALVPFLAFEHHSDSSRLLHRHG